MTCLWRSIDDGAGVPVVFSATGDGRVATNAARVAVQRSRSDLATATIRLTAVLREHLHLDPQTQDHGVLAIDLARSDVWLGMLPVDTDALARRAAALENPVVRLPSGMLTWDELISDTGTDAATWALMRSSSKAPPFALGIGTMTWGSRTDDNPLALVRRGHAAAGVRLETPRPPNADPAAKCTRGRRDDPVACTDAHADARGDADAALRAVVLLASRALHDAERHGRPRPALLALESLARVALTHVERTPVTRTDLPALAVARSILEASLDAVGISAPVPY